LFAVVSGGMAFIGGSGTGHPGISGTHEDTVIARRDSIGWADDRQSNETDFEASNRSSGSGIVRKA
jgi:hypothetical protein